MVSLMDRVRLAWRVIFGGRRVDARALPAGRDSVVWTHTAMPTWSAPSATSKRVRFIAPRGVYK